MKTEQSRCNRLTGQSILTKTKNVTFDNMVQKVMFVKLLMPYKKNDEINNKKRTQALERHLNYMRSVKVS